MLKINHSFNIYLSFPIISSLYVSLLFRLFSACTLRKQNSLLLYFKDLKVLSGIADVEQCNEYVKSKALDHLLPDELIRLPDPIVGRFASENDRSLAFRNLLRGYVLGLPSGQQTAKELKKKGYPIDPEQDLLFCDIPGWSCIESEIRNKLEKHTPLFFYLMREAGVKENGQRLGPVGSAILLEVFGAMLLHCDTFLKEPDWRPASCIAGEDCFTLADLVRYVNA